MILQALSDYYDRKSQDPDDRLAPAGFESKEIPFVLVLDVEGRLTQIDDTRTGDGKKKVARAFLVPQGVKKTSGVAANLLWDTAEYVLGIDTKGKPERVVLQHAAFRERAASALAAAGSDAGMIAVTRFFEQFEPAQLDEHPQAGEIRATNPNLTFRLQGDRALVCQRPAVLAALAQVDDAGGETGLCLVHGEVEAIERLHPSIKGVWGAQTSGANIVSFNLPAFNSFGKEQGANAPVGRRAVFAYTTALNHLLRKDSPQRMQVGDASTVFWSDKPSTMETAVPLLFGEPPKDNPDARTGAIRDLFASVHSGAYTAGDEENRFFVLGLAPNAARIAIRFWHVASVHEIGVRIARYFDELDVVGREHHGHPSLFRLLASIAVLGKADNIPPNLAGDTMRAILADLPYPATLLQAAVRRCRAEREVGYWRAALIKAVLNRQIRKQSSDTKEFTVALDRDNTNPGYRLGRLFAVLEKIQEDANPGINATIRDRYYGAASSTPATVFPQLMRLKNHHLAKLEGGRKVNAEKRIGEIIDGLQLFPPHLALTEQGAFAIGYYHQQQDFYTRKTDTKQGEME